MDEVLWMIGFGLLAFYMGGIGRRIAGGYLNQIAFAHGWIRQDDRVFGDTPARLIWGVLVAAGATLGGLVWWMAPFLVLGIWAGTTVGNQGSLGMGRGSDPYWRDFAGMTLHGACGGLLAAIPFCGLRWFGMLSVPPAWPWPDYAWWWLVGAGLLCAPLYELGYQLIERLGAKVKFGVGFRGETEMGEFFWGGAMGLGAFLCAAVAS